MTHFLTIYPLTWIRAVSMESFTRLSTMDPCSKIQLNSSWVKLYIRNIYRPSKTVIPASVMLVAQIHLTTDFGTAIYFQPSLTAQSNDDTKILLMGTLKQRTFWVEVLTPARILCRRFAKANGGFFISQIQTQTSTSQPANRFNTPYPTPSLLV